MLAQLLRLSTNVPSDLLNSKLYDDKTFYPAFPKDLNDCGRELIIESPFITRTFAMHDANFAKTKGP